MTKRDDIDGGLHRSSFYLPSLLGMVGNQPTYGRRSGDDLRKIQLRQFMRTASERATGLRHRSVAQNNKFDDDKGGRKGALFVLAFIAMTELMW